MDDLHQNRTVNNDGITLPEHDFAGLSQVISSAKPSLPGTENGFVPLDASDLRKPYEDIAKHLEERQKRLDESQIDPDNVIAELKDEKQKLVNKHENDFEQRITDIKEDYRGRTDELEKHLAEILRLKDIEIEIWQVRVKELDAKNKDLEQQRDSERNSRLDDLRDFHAQRITDLEQYHANELALTREFTQRWEEKVQSVENRIEKEQEQLHDDRKKLFTRLLASIREFKLSKLFK